MSSDPLIGTTVGGCEILEVIGQGGMGVIYKSRQKSLDRVVALKVLARHLATDINFVARFQKEARAIAKVNHPNILAVYDVGDDNTINYMIMELIDGQSLAETQAQRRGALPWDEATDYILQAGRGLEAAQAAGIIHRDIKPENLLATKKNVIKVSDFGLAKEADSSTGNTSVDAVMGTPAFMSPEQCDGKKVDCRSDIYSLGGTYYRLVTGRLPFEAETAMSMMYRHKHEALIPPHEIVHSIPQAVSAVIVKMMAKKREQRYQTMTEVINAVEAARKSGPPAAAASAPAPAPAGSPSAPPPAQNMIPVPQSFGIVPPGAMGAPPAGEAMLGDEPEAGMRRTSSRRMPAQPGAGVPFIPAADSSSNLSLPTGIMGLSPTGMGVPDEAYTAVSRGDEMMGRGDRLAALKQYRVALKGGTLDQATRSRVDGELRKEMDTRRAATESLLKRGLLVEASRECRVLADLDPSDEMAKTMLKDLETKLAEKRTAINDIRTAIAASQFEKAIRTWETMPPEMRDENVGKQIEQLRGIVVPALKLAEQGEKLVQQGRLEEGLSSFEDALKINPACEPARMGLQSTDQKVQRIEYMLKEGFQCMLEQNYDKAVNTWKPILEMRPGHPQAVKSIVDAYMAHAQNLRAHGDLEGALDAYKGATEIDPQNKTVRRSLEELINLNDKEQALMDRAQDAAAHHRFGEAMGYWKEVLRVNPTSRKAQQQIQALGKQRSSVLLKILLVLVVLGSAGWAGYQAFKEKTALSSAEALMKEKKYPQAQEVLSQWPFRFLKPQQEDLLAKAGLEVAVESARKLEREKRWQEAWREYEALGERISEHLQRQEMKNRAVVCHAKHMFALGEAAVNERKWDDAGPHFGGISELKSNVEIPELRDLMNVADACKNLVMKISIAEKLPENQQWAPFNEALDWTKQTKLPGVAEYIKTQMGKIKVRPDQVEKLKDDALAKLKQASPDYNGARDQLETALKLQPGHVASERLLQYIKDVQGCDKDERSLSPNMDPLKLETAVWDSDNRRDSFCIDRYEYPNEKGKMPKTGVTWLEARNLCIARGAELCTEHQWKTACKGAEKTNPWPYGPKADSNKCNTDGNAVMAAGSKPDCRSSIGVYDMSGNVAEWVSADGNDTNAPTRGGSFRTTAAQANCEDQLIQPQKTKSDETGFRCCKRLIQ
ncbi:MAG TPA: protein kinase [Planctomycetota bacterium]|jgi:tetratricopeptide (TPR) repeat protein/tRNA A-37 threonylcarbamoyl transferase component Bud32